MQTRRWSAIESVTQTVVGFTVSVLLWQYAVGPLFGYETRMASSFLITAVFTVSTLVRSYVIRRAFARTDRLLTP